MVNGQQLREWFGIADDGEGILTGGITLPIYLLEPALTVMAGATSTPLTDCSSSVPRPRPV